MPSHRNSLAFGHSIFTDPYGFHLGLTLLQWIQEEAARQSEERLDRDFGPSSNADRISEEKEPGLRDQADALLQKIASHTSLDFFRSSREMIAGMNDEDLKNYVQQLKQQLKDHKDAELAGENIQVIEADPDPLVEDKPEPAVTASEDKAPQKKTPLVALSLHSEKTPQTPVPSGPVDLEMTTFHLGTPACSPTRTNE